MRNRLIRIAVSMLSLLSVVLASCGISTSATPPTAETDVTAFVSPDLIRIEANPDIDIQTIIDGYPAGTRFLLASGVHRLQSITPRDNDVFIGEDGAVLNGAVVLNLFQKENDFWVATYHTEPGRRAHDYCNSDHPLCHYVEDLFFDDEPLRQVESLDNLVSGAWYFDYDLGRVYIADNPEGHLIEVSSVYSAFGGHASNVMISNLTIEKYANPAQQGAINGGDSNGWVIYNVTIQLNHGTGIRIGHNMQLLNSRINRNGQIGVAGVGDNVRVEGNEIAFNNYAGYQSTWEAGGTKFVSTNNLVVRNNYVHHNDGPGLWTDYDNHNALYEDNIVMYNQRNGIYHEISGAVTIRNNIVKFNGLNYDNWLWGSQILVSSSNNAEIYGNEVVVDWAIGNGISIVNQDRGPQSYNNYVHDNVIVYLSNEGKSGVVTDFDHERFWRDSNNRFDENTYHVRAENNTHWAWNDEFQTWEEFQSYGQETNGNLVIGLIPEDVLVVPEWVVDIPAPF